MNLQVNIFYVVTSHLALLFLQALSLIIIAAMTTVLHRQRTFFTGKRKMLVSYGLKVGSLAKYIANAG